MTLQLPDINGKTTPQQLDQIKTYLYQLASYLQVAQGGGQDTGMVSPKRYVPTTASQGYPISEETWDATKALIIKSAKIVEAFSEKISYNLEGKYLAKSDFGTYKVETNAKLEATSSNFTQIYEKYQELETDVVQIRNTTAYIRSGELDEQNGWPVYGVEVGQKNTDQSGKETFNAYARFTADRLSFFDRNGKELAWVSGYKLYITHVEITGSLVGGGYEVDMTDGWSWIWIGD